MNSLVSATPSAETVRLLGGDLVDSAAMDAESPGDLGWPFSLGEHGAHLVAVYRRAPATILALGLADALPLSLKYNFPLPPPPCG
jgi:hypothetical protein